MRLASLFLAVAHSLSEGEKAHLLVDFHKCDEHSCSFACTCVYLQFSVSFHVNFAMDASAIATIIHACRTILLSMRKPSCAHRNCYPSEIFANRKHTRRIVGAQPPRPKHPERWVKLRRGGPRPARRHKPPKPWAIATCTAPQWSGALGFNHVGAQSLRPGARSAPLQATRTPARRLTANLDLHHYWIISYTASRQLIPLVDIYLAGFSDVEE